MSFSSCVEDVEGRSGEALSSDETSSSLGVAGPGGDVPGEEEWMGGEGRLGDGPGSEGSDGSGGLGLRGEVSEEDEEEQEEEEWPGGVRCITRRGGWSGCEGRSILRSLGARGDGSASSRGRLLDSGVWL